MLTTERSMQRMLRWMCRVIVMILITANLATVVLAEAAPAVQDSQPSFPIRATFYYPWFPEAWRQQGFNPFTNYRPSLGFYDASLAVTRRHIAAMRYGGIQAGIVSWWGQGSRTDTRMPRLLEAAVRTGFRWAIYYENESQGDPSVAQIRSDLAYIRDKYGNNRTFLRVNGKFVVFVYADGNDACGMADRWKRANTVGAYVVLKVFTGYLNCPSQPNSWHQYSPAVAADYQRRYSYAISPGFWKKGDAVQLARDLNRWRRNVRAMVASGARWQLITTFNEWGEGTAVESAREWRTSSGYGAYLDVLHNNGQ
jgi:Glycosyl hydrolase family 99